jgi:hypothetical protein
VSVLNAIEVINMAFVIKLFTYDEQ